MSEKPEKPLHVQVAEALGCKPVRPSKGWEPDSWFLCSCSESEHVQADSHYPGMLARYDTDWSATGPLLDKMRLHGEMRLDPTCHEPQWCAFYIPPGDEDIIESAKHGTLLLAVCNLILALHAAGKLPKL